MDKAFNISSVIRTLRRMTQTPNPANPDRMMLTIEDLDTPSPDSLYWREQAKRNIPISDHGTACFMKPHRNLLREHPDEPIHEIKVTEERDFPTSPRSTTQNEGIRSQVLLPEEQTDSSLVSVDNLPW